MSIQWFTPRGGQYASSSADGYYAVGLADTDGLFPAFHIEALWAIPKRLDRAETIAEAQRICESHRAAQAA